MDPVQRLRQLVEQASPSPATIRERAQRIHAEAIKRSAHLARPNFERIAPADLRCLFDLYDEESLEGLCRACVPTSRLGFRLSSRMTRSGGTTRQYRGPAGRSDRRYEITVSTTLLGGNFDAPARPVTVAGMECRDRLQALQRVFEHELTHLVEMVIWDASRCSAARFQSIARRLFGHVDHRHHLITPREEAATRFGVRVGSRVRFEHQGTPREGLVNRVTRRATVLVPSPQGRPFSDGKRYVVFYVPIARLQVIT